MIVVLVHIHVKPEAIDDFIAAAEENARHSIQEAGIARFDFIQQVEDPTPTWPNTRRPSTTSSGGIRWRG
jgi:quinol monooxygenase YgiN